MSNSLAPQPLQTARHHSEFSFSKPHTTVSFATTAASTSTLQREGGLRKLRGPPGWGQDPFPAHPQPAKGRLCVPAWLWDVFRCPPVWSHLKAEAFYIS